MTSPPSFSVSFLSCPLPLPSFTYFQLHLTPSAHLPPPLHQLQSLPAQLCYVHCWTSCHAPPQFNLTELHHVHTHLMMDHDLTQSRHHHAGQHGTVSDPAISNISGHLWTGRDGVLTAHAPHSATFSSTYFLIQLITFMYICI